MRLKKRKNNGFSLIELMFSSVIIVTVMTGATTAYIATIKENKALQMSVLAQDMLKRVLNFEVRNKPLMATTGNNSLCGDPTTTGTLANLLTNGTAPNLSTINSSANATLLTDTSSWNRTILANTLATSPLEEQILRSSEANVSLLIRPINVANPGGGTYSYSESRVTVTVIFKWKNAKGNNFNQVETSTIQSYKGIFDKSLAIIK